MRVGDVLRSVSTAVVICVCAVASALALHLWSVSPVDDRWEVIEFAHPAVATTARAFQHVDASLGPELVGGAEVVLQPASWGGLALWFDRTQFECVVPFTHERVDVNGMGSLLSQANPELLQQTIASLREAQVVVAVASRFERPIWPWLLACVVAPVVFAFGARLRASRMRDRCRVRVDAATGALLSFVMMATGVLLAWPVVRATHLVALAAVTVMGTVGVPRWHSQTGVALVVVLRTLVVSATVFAAASIAPVLHRADVYSALWFAGVALTVGSAVDRRWLSDVTWQSDRHR